jgi:hypothetical protein
MFESSVSSRLCVENRSVITPDKFSVVLISLRNLENKVDIVSIEKEKRIFKSEIKSNGFDSS